MEDVFINKIKTIKYLNIYGMLTMAKRGIFLVLCMLILLSFSVYAEQQNLGTFKRYGCVNLIQTCANCTYVNFTSVLYPNSTQALGNVLASNLTNSIFNYTFCSTNALGQYIVNGIGNPNWVDTIFSYTFYITPTGTKESNNPISLGIVTFFLLFNIGLFALYFIKKEFAPNPYINLIAKRSLMVVCIYFTMWNLSMVGSLIAASNYDIMNNIWSLMEVIGWAGHLSVLFLVVTTLFNYLDMWKQQKHRERFGED